MIVTTDAFALQDGRQRRRPSKGRAGTGARRNDGRQSRRAGCIVQLLKASAEPMIEAVVRALSMAFAMGWEILWPLILGFFLSAVVQAIVSYREMSRLLPDDHQR